MSPTVCWWGRRPGLRAKQQGPHWGSGCRPGMMVAGRPHHSQAPGWWTKGQSPTTGRWSTGVAVPLVQLQCGGRGGGRGAAALGVSGSWGGCLRSTKLPKRGGEGNTPWTSSNARITPSMSAWRVTIRSYYARDNGCSVRARAVPWMARVPNWVFFFFRSFLSAFAAECAASIRWVPNSAPLVPNS